MKTITISRKQLSGDLIVLPRKDYERLLALANARAELEKGLHKAVHEAAQGKLSGPFKNVDELMASLE